MARRWTFAAPLGPGGGLYWGGMIPLGRGLPDLWDGGLHRRVVALAEARQYDGGRVDLADREWQASALKLNGPQLRFLVDAAIEGRWIADPAETIAAYRALADELGEAGLTALVAVTL